MSVIKIDSKDEFATTIKEKEFVVIHFYAEWAAQCEPMNTVLEEMSKYPQFRGIVFAKFEAESVPEVSVQYHIAAVPTFLLFKKGELVETINGANPPELTKKINQHAGTNATTPSGTITPAGPPLEERLKSLINLENVMVFMKGNPSTPRCGFSRTLVGILNETGVKYETFDILSDEDVRQGLKKFSNWPTYPQVYVKGELIGGLDIVQELHKSGELVSSLSPN